MRRLFLCGAVAASLWASGSPRPARADLFTYCKRVFALNNNWPAPYIQQDRAAVAAPFTIMSENGWRTQNLMCDYHFTPGDKALTSVGEKRLRWILTQAPIQHRMVFIQKADTTDETRARVDAVQAAAVAVQGAAAQIAELEISTPGRPAEVVDAINQAALGSIPAPVLPKGGGGGTTAGSTNAGSISSGAGSGGR